MSTDAIKRVQASIEKLHGDQRTRDGKYQSFTSWQKRIREREQANGLDPSPILKRQEPGEFVDLDAMLAAHAKEYNVKIK